MRLLLERSLREDVTVRFEIEPGLWPAEVDPSQLEVAVLNIAVNARDAMPDGGIITLLARNRPAITVDGGTGDFVEVAVSDTGAGMTPETAHRVFRTVLHHQGGGQGHGAGPVAGLRLLPLVRRRRRDHQRAGPGGPPCPCCSRPRPSP
ncbi:MAG: ATP-binding protein [Caulobacteraceae bacterium]